MYGQYTCGFFDVWFTSCIAAASFGLARRYVTVRWEFGPPRLLPPFDSLDVMSTTGSSCFNLGVAPSVSQSGHVCVVVSVDATVCHLLSPSTDVSVPLPPLDESDVVSTPGGRKRCVRRDVNVFVSIFRPSCEVNSPL